MIQVLSLDQLQSDIYRLILLTADTPSIALTGKAPRLILRGSGA